MRVVDRASTIWKTLRQAAAFVPLINDFLPISTDSNIRYDPILEGQYC
jgi:hypothetical protein